MSTLLPPPDLRIRVAGTDDPGWFVKSGAMAAQDFDRALGTVGRALDQFSRVYEFGCGCGRVTAHLRRRLGSALRAVTDVDTDALDWLRPQLPDVEVRGNDALPPLEFADASFDLVLGWSVFTHFPEDFQDAWLAELARVTAPGGYVLQTVNGAANLEWSRQHALHDWSYHKRIADPTAFALDDIDAALADRGFVSWREADWHPWLPDYYHTTFHTPRYVREHWSRWFTVVAVLEGQARTNHDMVVLRRSPPRRGPVRRILRSRP